MKHDDFEWEDGNNVRIVFDNEHNICFGVDNINKFIKDITKTSKDDFHNILHNNKFLLTINRRQIKYIIYKNQS